jgi:hypothetical protein
MTGVYQQALVITISKVIGLKTKFFVIFGST